MPNLPIATTSSLMPSHNRFGSSIFNRSEIMCHHDASSLFSISINKTLDVSMVLSVSCTSSRKFTEITSFPYARNYLNVTYLRGLSQIAALYYLLKVQKGLPLFLHCYFHTKGRKEMKKNHYLVHLHQLDKLHIMASKSTTSRRDK